MRVLLEWAPATDRGAGPRAAADALRILTARTEALGIPGAVRARGETQFVVDLRGAQPKLATVQGRELALRPGANVIGSRRDATLPTLVLTDKGVAGRHATLTLAAAGATLTAHAGKVLVDGRPVAVGRQQRLMLGSRLQIGGARLALVPPAEAMETIRQLQRVAKLELVWLKDIRSASNPAGRLRMELGPGAPTRVFRTYDAAGKPGTFAVRVADGTGYRFTDRENRIVSPRQVLSQGEVVVTGRDLQPNARPVQEPMTREPGVELTLNDAGSARLAAFTRDHTGQHLAIVLDGQILSAPMINAAITDGRVHIPEAFRSMRDAKQVAEWLNAGPLPGPLKIAQLSLY
jgi:hypothetical protein